MVDRPDYDSAAHFSACFKFMLSACFGKLLPGKVKVNEFNLVTLLENV